MACTIPNLKKMSNGQILYFLHHAVVKSIRGNLRWISWANEIAFWEMLDNAVRV